MKLRKSIWKSLTKIFSRVNENTPDQTSINRNKDNKLQVDNSFVNKDPETRIEIGFESTLSNNNIQQSIGTDEVFSKKPHVEDDSSIREIDLVIGFDFGTSTSKVVIQAPDLPGSPARAVNFGRVAVQEFPYLVPTTIWTNEVGEISLEERDGYEQISDLKIRLLPGVNFGISTNSNSLDAAIIAMCYIAKVLRISRKWYLSTNIGLIGKRDKINWSFNLGVPSPCIENNKEHTLFKCIGRGAWILSGSDAVAGEININKAAIIYERLTKKNDWPDNIDSSLKCEFNIIPEIAGGAVGYAFSDQRRKGLHIMIDIGAGTLDVCMLNLWNDDVSNRYALLTADVKPLGTVMYHRHMLHLIYKKNLHLGKNKFAYNELQIPITDMRKYKAYCDSQGCININETDLNNQKQIFETKIEDVLKEIIWRTKNTRDPKSSSWKNTESLPLIMIGGGSKSTIYLNSIKRLNSWMKQTVGNRGFSEIMSVELPGLAKDVKSEYLTVAWGLSHRALDIGQITASDKIKDIEPNPVVERIYRNDDD